MMGGKPGSTDEGLTPRLCRDILLEVNNIKGALDVTSGGVISSSKMHLSFFEVYNERVHDLLKENPEEPCRVREHPDTGAFVENLTVREVLQMQDVISTMAEGLYKRQTAETLMNAQSSRSHAVLTVLVTQEVVLSFGAEDNISDSVPAPPASPSCTGRDSIPPEHKTPRRARRASSRCDVNGRKSIVRIGKACLVDLAGSERLCSTGATGQRLKEGTHINLSLSTLGDVIKALSERSEKGSGDSGKFVPYRNSVLTYVLKDSIGGNSRTSIIATISPNQLAYAESLNTLRFITKAKLIVNRVSVNESSGDSKYIQSLHRQVAMYKSKLATSLSDMNHKEAQYAAQIALLKKQLVTANEVITAQSLLLSPNRRLGRRDGETCSITSNESLSASTSVTPLSLSTTHGLVSLDGMFTISSSRKSRVSKSSHGFSSDSSILSEALRGSEGGQLLSGLRVPQHRRSSSFGVSRSRIASVEGGAHGSINNIESIFEDSKETTSGQNHRCGSSGGVGENFELTFKKSMQFDSGNSDNSEEKGSECNRSLEEEEVPDPVQETLIGNTHATQQHREALVASMSLNESTDFDEEEVTSSSSEVVIDELSMNGFRETNGCYKSFALKSSDSVGGTTTEGIEVDMLREAMLPCDTADEEDDGGALGSSCSGRCSCGSTEESDIEIVTALRMVSVLRLLYCAFIFLRRFVITFILIDYSQDLDSARAEIESLRHSLFIVQEENVQLEHQLSIIDRDLEWLLMPSE